MILGIMQPYFFPYLGYFELIHRTDTWVVFDVVQYNARSWMNRNRILHPTSGFQYVTVPIRRQPHGTSIRKIHLMNAASTRSKILGQLAHYRPHAPFYEPVVDLVRSAFDQASGDRLVDLNVSAIDAVCRYLGIPFRPLFASELDIDAGTVEHPGQWSLRIADSLGAAGYINPPGGQDIFKPDEWRSRNIDLSFTTLQEIEYEPKPLTYIPHLSILDLMMWMEPKAIMAFLEQKRVQSVTMR